MIYLVFLLFSYLYFAFLRKYSIYGYGKLLLYSLPFVLFWCLIIGGQYNVGTDYFSYMYYFTSGDTSYFDWRGDYLFADFIDFCNRVGIDGQGIFFVLSLIWVLILLYLGDAFFGNKRLYLFLFVFITFSGVFNNQMNILRQYFAIYLYTMALCRALRKDFISAVLLLLLVVFIHSSSFAVILLSLVAMCCLKFIENRNVLFFMICGSVLLSFLLSDAVVSFFIPYFEQYISYYESDAFEDVSWINRMSKYIYIPLMLYAVYLFPKMNLSEFERRFFVIGICGYCLKTSLMSLSLIGRVGKYGEILMCIPIVFMLIYLSQTRSKLRSVLIYMYLLLPYVIKVLFFPIREYSYHSYFFNYM